MEKKMTDKEQQTGGDMTMDTRINNGYGNNGLK
jgi:hypothetical protein